MGNSFNHRSLAPKRPLMPTRLRRTPTPRRPRQEGERRFPWLTWRNVLIAGLVVGVTSLVGIGIVVAKVKSDLPDVSDPSSFQLQQGSILYDKDKREELYRLSGDVQRRIVPLDQMSKYMQLALLAAEDDQFYGHAGFDTGGIIKAVCHEASSQIGLGTLGGLCPQRGGSTLTQQLVKNVLLSNERTWKRKLKEILLSAEIEQQYNKEQILENYLNYVSLGGNFSGVEQAANTYFDTTAEELTPAQSAILASLVQLPSYYSPYGEQAFSHLVVDPQDLVDAGIRNMDQLISEHDDWWVYGLVGREVELPNGDKLLLPGRANWVLGRMYQDGCASPEDVADGSVKLPCLTNKEYAQGMRDLDSMEFQDYHTTITAPHFVMYVREEAKQRLKDAYPDMEEDQLETFLEGSGLQIVTTLDLEHQSAAEGAVSHQAQKNLTNYNANNAALIAIKPDTGYITAMVGSVDYWNDDIDGKVNVTDKKRLPGSSFKPLAMAASIANGDLGSDSVLFDLETEFAGGWKPKNFDGKFRGPVTIRQSLGESRNIPSVKAALITGVDKVHEFVETLGIELEEDADFYGGSLALGSAGASPIEMVKSYAVFANGGYSVEPTAIMSISDRDGNLIYSAPELNPERETIINPGVSYIISDILSDTSVRPNDWNKTLSLDGLTIAAKTGTADKKVDEIATPVDGWTVGYSPFLVTAVWAGNTKGEVMAANASGLGVASPIWHEFMTITHEDAPREWFKQPSEVVSVSVSRLSGLLPNEFTPDAMLVKSLFLKGKEPKKVDQSFAQVTIDTVSGLLATEFTPESTKQEMMVLAPKAYYSENPKWQNPVDAWVRSSGASWLAALGISSSGTFGVLPDGYDDVHTADNAGTGPQFTIISPTSGTVVAAGTLDLRIDLTAPNEMDLLVIKWDGEVLVDTTNVSNTYTIAIPRDAQGDHRITVEVTDGLGYTANASTDITIGDVPVRTANMKLSSVSAKPLEKVTVTVTSKDQIESLSLYANSTLVEEVTSKPYRVVYIPSADQAGTSVSLTAEVTFVGGGSATVSEVLTVVGGETPVPDTDETVDPVVDVPNPSTRFALTAPAAGSSVSCDAVIPISVSIPDVYQGNAASIEVWVVDSSGGTSFVDAIGAPLGAVATARYTVLTCGDMEFYAKAIAPTGDATTQRVSVTAQ